MMLDEGILMDANTSKNRLDFSIKHNKIITKKIILLILISLLVITIFSTITVASSVKDASGDDNEIAEARITSTISKLGDTIKDFISERLGNSKRVPTFRLVTRYQKNESSPIIEKATRLKLFSPMSIDVNNDYFKDIRVWVFRLPGIDLHPPALCIKNVFLIRRLPGMNNIKNDFFEIYLEYNPKIITKLFYLTKDIDRIRVGYQSPAGEEIPKTCIITDKIVPHLIYPMKKVTHKISVNPCSIVGKENLNLILAMADLEDEMVKSELIMQVNYTPAIRVSEIIFEREKTKLFGRGQSLEITRTGDKPSNVTLFIKELMWRGFTVVKQGSITVENIPKKINLEWLIGRKGYIDINTHNDEIGRVRAVFNNTVIVGFAPKNNMSGRVSWENRTLIGVVLPGGIPFKGFETFDISFSVRDSFSLEDFSLMATNQENATNRYLLESKASLLSLDLDAGTDFGNVIAEYWLFPIYFFPTDPSQNITINIDIKNLTLKAENFTFNVKTTVSKKDTIEGNVNNSLNGNFSAKYFEISSEDAKIFASFNLETPEISADVKVGLDMHVEDVTFSITRIMDNSTSTANGSFSSLDFSTYGTFSLSLSEIAEMSVVVNGSFELNDFSFNGDNSWTIKSFNVFGDINLGYHKYPDTIDISLKGKGNLVIKNLYAIDGKNNILEWELVNLSGNCQSFSTNISSDHFSSTKIKSINGTLEIKNAYLKYDNLTGQVDLFYLSGEGLSFSTNISSETISYSKIESTGNGTIKIKNFNLTSSDEILQIGEFLLSLEGNYSDYQYNNSISYSTNRRLEGNGALKIRNYYNRNYWNITRKIDEIYLTLKGNYSEYYYKDSNILTSNISLEGEGNLTIIGLNKHSPNTTLKYDLFHFSGETLSLSTDISSESSSDTEIESFVKGIAEIKNVSLKYYNLNCHTDSIHLSGDYLSFYTNISSEPFSKNSKIESFGGTVEIKNITVESSYNIGRNEDSLSPQEENYSEKQIGDSTNASDNNYLESNLNASLNASLEKIHYFNRYNRLNESLYNGEDYSEKQLENFTTSSVNNLLKSTTMPTSSDNDYLEGKINSSLEKIYHDKVKKSWWRCGLLYLSGNIRTSANRSSDSQSYSEISLKINGTLTIENLYARDSQNNILNWNSVKLSGEYLSISTELFSYNTDIESFRGTLEVKNAYLKYYDNLTQVDLINLSGDYLLTYNHVYDLLSFDGDASLEIRNLLIPSRSFKSFYGNLNGDFTFYLNWLSNNDVVLESKNGITIHFFIERDRGIFDIVDIEGTFGPGYLHAGGHIGEDGFVFVDSSEIVEFIDLVCTFTNGTNNKGIRFSWSSSEFDADAFLLQWDTMTLDLPRLRAIPYNWYITGSLSRDIDIDIDIISGNKIYNLWPLIDSGNSNEETENTEETNYNSGYGIGALDNIMPPNKPQKPKGPTGGIVIGRIVRGHNYTFSTTTNGNGQYVSYNWSWGDGTYSGWSPFIKSGIGVTGSHTWTPGTCPKTYNIKVKARNINGEESEWSDALTITVRENFSGDGQNSYQNDELVEQSQNNYYQEQNQNNNQGQANNS